MTVNETRDFSGITPKVGDIIAVTVPSSISTGVLKKAKITSFKECQRTVKMFIEPLTANAILYRDYICLTNVDSNQFIIIHEPERTPTDL